MQDRSVITRNRILEKSFQLFLKNGYATTGVAQICEEAQVSKGAFYHHFPSKHDVFITILDLWTKELENKFALIKESPVSIPEKLTLMADSMNEIFIESENIPIFMEFWMQSMRDKSVSAKTIAPYFRFLRYFEELFQKGIEEGSLSSNTNTKNSARLLMSFAMGSIIQSMIEPAKNWPEITKSNLQILLNGITKE